MEKPSEHKDILQETYQGPGRAITSAGYMAASHLLTMIVSGLALGAVGGIFHKKVASVQETFTRIGVEHGNSTNFFQRTGAKAVGGIPKAFVWCVDHVPFSKKVTGSARLEARAPSIIFLGGLGVAVGWIGSTIWGIAKGSHQGNLGKHQFQRAQEEIKNLREDNADLNHINDELHAKYVRAATRLNTIERDSAMRAEEAASFASTENAAQQTPAPKPEVQLDTAQHLGKLAQPELSANLA